MGTMIRIIETGQLSGHEHLRLTAFTFCLPPTKIRQPGNIGNIIKALIDPAQFESVDQVVSDDAGIWVLYGGSVGSGFVFCQDVVGIINQVLETDFEVTRDSFYSEPHYRRGTTPVTLDILMQQPGFQLLYMIG